MLTREELIDLLFEKSVEREDYDISCQGSFLGSLAQLCFEMGEDLAHGRLR